MILNAGEYLGQLFLHCDDLSWFIQLGLDPHNVTPLPVVYPGLDYTPNGGSYVSVFILPTGNRVHMSGIVADNFILQFNVNTPRNRGIIPGKRMTNAIKDFFPVNSIFTTTDYAFSVVSFTENPEINDGSYTTFPVSLGITVTHI